MERQSERKVKHPFLRCADFLNLSSADTLVLQEAHNKTAFLKNCLSSSSALILGKLL